MITADLPADDADFTRHVKAIEDVLPSDTADVVLAGHSIAGLFLPALGDRARHVVYLCAMLAAPGESMRELTAREDVFSAGWPELAARQEVADDRSTAWPPDAAIEAFYPDCDSRIAGQAAARLRPQYWRFQKESNDLGHYPATPSTYVLCREDPVINPQWSRTAAVNRLGVRPVELEGGHSPFLSRPKELAACMLAATE